MTPPVAGRPIRGAGQRRSYSAGCSPPSSSLLARLAARPPGSVRRHDMHSTTAGCPPPARGTACARPGRARACARPRRRGKPPSSGVFKNEGSRSGLGLEIKPSRADDVVQRTDASILAFTSRPMTGLISGCSPRINRGRANAIRPVRHIFHFISNHSV